MKYVSIILFLFMAACASPKYVISDNPHGSGKYSLEIVHDKALVIEYGAGPKPHYTLADKLGTSVVVYKYVKATSGQYEDNFYNEEVVFEYTGKKITPESINKNAMLFGVSCYCKGKAGHYLIDDPVIKSGGKDISITIPDIIDNQIIHHINIKSM